MTRQKTAGGPPFFMGPEHQVRRVKSLGPQGERSVGTSDGGPKKKKKRHRILSTRNKTREEGKRERKKKRDWEKKGAEKTEGPGLFKRGGPTFDRPRTTKRKWGGRTERPSDNAKKGGMTWEKAEFLEGGQIQHPYPGVCGGASDRRTPTPLVRRIQDERGGQKKRPVDGSTGKSFPAESLGLKKRKKKGGAARRPKGVEVK